MKFGLIALAMTFSLTQVASASTATYFRAWQGFKKTDTTNSQLIEKLPAFMQSTMTTYEGKGLNNYLVAVPPSEKPSFIPDEFALVAFESEEAYKAVRATPEGIAYGESHWEIFDKATSKSAPMLRFNEAEMPTVLHNTSYDVIGDAIDWTQGHTAFFVGLRKANMSSEEFLKGLAKHLSFVSKTLKPMGLQGYIIIANNDYEVAYMHWSSKEAADAAFSSEAGASVVANASAILDNLMFQGVENFKGEVKAQGFYRTISK